LASSAYNTQFHGSFADHDWQRLWKTKTENKCKLFGWLILQNRLWMVDRIAKHGGQTNQVCRLCHTHPESTIHMNVQCTYAKMVWQGLQAWLGTALQQPLSNRYRRFQEWWTNMINIHPTQVADRAQKKSCTLSGISGKSGVDGSSTTMGCLLKNFK
jgi:hypothetical protein